MTVKLTISLPDDLADEVRAAVRNGRAASVSAYIADAIEWVRDRPTMGQVLDEMEAEFGPIPQEVHAWVDAQLADFPPPLGPSIQPAEKAEPAENAEPAKQLKPARSPKLRPRSGE